MTLFPDAQRKAKEEVDTIIGLERLISYDDRLSLPYVEALYREVMRWRCRKLTGDDHISIISRL